MKSFSAPFIVMRHWADMKQDGEYWHGEFETDDIDWKLAELIVNMQYACQRHYFLGMAEKYFDDQQREISINSHRPDEFVVEDVMTCFALSNMAVARVRVNRLVKDGLVERVGEFLEGGNNKAVFKKTGKVMR